MVEHKEKRGRKPLRKSGPYTNAEYAQRHRDKLKREAKAAEIKSRKARWVPPEGGGKVEDLHALAESGYRARAAMIDPGWHFDTRSKLGEGRSPIYRTDSLDAIKALPVGALTAPDAAVLVWVTDPFLFAAREVIEAWGLRYVTVGFTWAKLNPSGGGWHMGQGYWTRSNPEMCLLATKGSPKRLNADVRQLIVAPMREHSRKPDEIHERIERLLPGPYLELFARRERPGWTTWGNEVQRS